MVVKHCPSCKRALAVACKTCSECNYVFLARKTPPSKPVDAEALKRVAEKGKTDASNSSVNTPVKKRGRPKGSKDKQKRLPKGYKQLSISRKMELSQDADWTAQGINVAAHTGGASQDGRDLKLVRKRGRPRGSKNKSTHSPMFYAEDFDEFDSDERDDCIGNDESFYIPAEKREKFSLILDDINNRILGQAFQV